jgi:hypothetical protein
VTAALVAYALNDVESADTLLAEYEASKTRGMWHFVVDSDLTIWLTIVALGLGDIDRAEALSSGQEPWTTCGRSALAHGRALVAEAAGRREDAASLYAEAAAGWEAWGSVPLRAYALVGLGNCAGDAAALAEGLEIFAELGAMPVSPRVASARQQQV